MSSVDTQERRFNPHADLITFYTGIRVAPLSDYEDPLEASDILAIQMNKLNEEVDEVRSASTAEEMDPGHMAEEAVDVAYVAIGIACLLGNAPTEFGDSIQSPSPHDDHVLALEEAHAVIRAAHEGDQREALGTHLAGLASMSFGLVRALGYCPEELWDKKHVVNTTKYDRDIYAELRAAGLSHEEAISNLKDSWPQRRLLLDADHLPIDMSNGHLVV